MSILRYLFLKKIYQVRVTRKQCPKKWLKEQGYLGRGREGKGNRVAGCLDLESCPVEHLLLRGTRTGGWKRSRRLRILQANRP